MGAQDLCSLSYLPNKKYDISKDSLIGFSLKLSEQLGVELKILEGDAKPALNKKFLFVNKQEYEKYGLRYLESTVLDLFSKKLYDIIDNEKLSSFNKYYPKILKLSGTDYTPSYNKDLGNYFIINPARDAKGSNLNRFAAYVQRIASSKLIVSAKHIFETGNNASYINQEIRMSLQEAVWGDMLESGSSLHELGHAISEKKLMSGNYSLFHSYVEYEKPQEHLTYPDLLIFEELYTFPINIERSLYNLKKELELHGNYLVNSTANGVYLDFIDAFEVFEENLNLIISYVSKVNNLVTRNKGRIDIEYHEFDSLTNSLHTEFKIKGDEKYFHYDLGITNPQDFKKRYKSKNQSNAILAELKRITYEQLNLFKELKNESSKFHNFIDIESTDYDKKVMKNLDSLYKIAKKIKKLVRHK